MKVMRGGWALVLVVVLLFGLVGCGGSKETQEQKLTAFKQAHQAIYDAWQATTTTQLHDLLAKGLVDPLLSQQMTQQNAVMQQRLMLNEKHIVKSIAFNQLSMVKDGSDEFTVYADWTVDGVRDHGDVHEMTVSYKKQFHVVKQKDGTWKIDQMTDPN
ncbi:hypothetical protein [Tumebacillus flagellatus]|uniref:DUF4440 domain-containing protein n=1 Tax=Tumebacillus flagellatus TaxID=1157490 RepID=A0A074LSH7_9BACL|nr:hypothetical protein [Tumebacillus flagellatus]KEO83440.1 hypothetical protein EL26_10735 [Tumebacillus flagellatus]